MKMTGIALLRFVHEQMRQSSYYQPLVIRSLIEAGGTLSREDLAKALLVEDQFAMAKFVKTLMRWPKRTLEKHGIVAYDRTARTFKLLVEFDGNDVREQIVADCDAAIRNWQQKEAPKVASRFFSVIEASGGRCQSCGVPGSVRPIDVDHIVPRNKSVKGYVTMGDGTRVPVDDVRNLQALCSRCNRGKRDTSSYDFRPSRERLVDTIRIVLEHAADLGYKPAELLAVATADGGYRDAKNSQST